MVVLHIGKTKITVKCLFFDPPRESKISLKSRVVREMFFFLILSNFFLFS